MKKALLFAFAAMLVAGLAPGASALHAPAAQAKKKCKIVIKIVHGHKRKVRVCHTVKPSRSLPKSVSVTLDSAHTATASITADTGGTLTSGKATLTFPAGAVSSTTSVTMTPVKRVSGLPGTVLGAVQFAPDGLQLLKPVTLTFAVSSTSGLKAFSYAGNGTAFHLYPVKVAGGKATLELTHFSGYGIGQRLPPSSVARLRTELDTLVRPTVGRATTSSGVFEQAARLYSSWKNEVDLLPPAERAKFARDIGVLETALVVGFKNFVNDEYSDCVKDHDLRALTNMVRAKAIIQSIGLLSTDANAYYQRKFRGCFRFELDFDAVITTVTEAADAEGGIITQTGVSHVRVRGLKLNVANDLSNQAPLDYVDFSYSLSHCSSATSTNVLEPFKATLYLDSPHAISTQPYPTVSVFVGHATESITISCPRAPPFQTEGPYYDLIRLLHGGDSFTIDWDSFERGVAHKVYAGTSPIPLGTVSEYTTFDLRHTPE